MTSNVRARLHLEQGLHDAIAQQQFELFLSTSRLFAR